MRLATTDETTFPPAHGERLQETIPGSLLEVLPDAEHWMPGQCAEPVASRIESFLAGHSGADPRLT